MLFNSWEFAAFLPAVCAGMFMLPIRWRPAWLLAASYVFYGVFSVPFALLMLLASAIAYGAALGIVAAAGRSRTYWLAAGVAGNLSILLLFKYADFVLASIEYGVHLGGEATPLPRLSLLLPMGISFYTFQCIGYLVDVYRGAAPAERSFSRFALYVAFFPQLVAGPIERASHLLPQFHCAYDFDYDRAVAGLRRIGWGLFKKVVIADRLAAGVQHVFGTPETATGPAILVATVLFSVQIYADFSGYCDMAIGAARLLGFNLSENFDRPYAAGSIREFWSRWHISLSTWFKDYVYFPLGGNRVSRVRWYCNLLAVFVLSGLWHGASASFVAWGMLHGVFLIAEDLLRRSWNWASTFATDGSGRPAAPYLLPKWAHVVVTYAAVNFAWIFFRAESLSDALLLTRRLSTGWHVLLDAAAAWETARVGFSPAEFMMAACAVATLEMANLLRRGNWANVGAWPGYARWPAYYALAGAILACGAFGRSPFLYFQF